jgi:hypothetical protein
MAYPQAPIEMEIYMELPQGLWLATPRTTCSSSWRTFMVRSRLEEYGTHFSWTSLFHWATLLH